MFTYMSAQVQSFAVRGSRPTPARFASAVSGQPPGLVEPTIAWLSKTSCTRHRNAKASFGAASSELPPLATSLKLGRAGAGT